MHAPAMVTGSDRPSYAPNASVADAAEELDRQRFTARYFPGNRRYSLEVLTARGSTSSTAAPPLTTARFYFAPTRGSRLALTWARLAALALQLAPIWLLRTAHRNSCQSGRAWRPRPR
jgi:hypothetical protein